MAHHGADDFASFMDASRCLQSAESSLSQLLNGSTYRSAGRDDFIALVKSMRYHDVSKVVIDAVIKYFEEGIDVGNTNVHLALSEHQYERAESLLAEIDLCDEELVRRLSSYHWLMPTKPSADLVSVSSRYPPGTTLADKDGRYWLGKAIQNDHYKAQIHILYRR